MISTILLMVLQAPQILETAMPVGRLQWPTEINAAMLPYLGCSQREFDKAQTEIEKRNGSRGLDRAGMLEADTASLQECADERVIAREAALHLAARVPNVSKEQRIQIVDAALSSIDGRNAQLIALMSSGPIAPKAEAAAGQIAKENE